MGGRENAEAAGWGWEGWEAGAGSAHAEGTTEGDEKPTKKKKGPSIAGLDITREEAKEARNQLVLAAMRRLKLEDYNAMLTTVPYGMLGNNSKRTVCGSRSGTSQGRA